MLARAMTWVDASAQLYRLNDLRLAHQDRAPYAEHDAAWRQALHDMAQRRSQALSEATLCEPALQVLRSRDLINPRTWLLAYLQACCDAGNHAPADLRAFLPWTMTAPELAALLACPPGVAAAKLSSMYIPTIEGLDTS